MNNRLIQIGQVAGGSVGPYTRLLTNVMLGLAVFDISQIGGEIRPEQFRFLESTIAGVMAEINNKKTVGNPQTWRT